MGATHLGRFRVFSGVGGLEHGLATAGLHTIGMVANDPHALAVLRARSPGVPIELDVRNVSDIPMADILVAGFPCQDLNQSGRLKGIHGERSGLVRHVLAAIANSERRPPTLLFENVPFLLNFRRGQGMAWLTKNLEELGYRWAYRVIDSQWFGLAQRRRRLLDDLHDDVRTAAACALGRLRRPEGKRMLVHLLGTAPTTEIIDAVVALADEECVVLVARIARHKPDLAGAARNALEQIDHPLAMRLVASLAASPTVFPHVASQRKGRVRRSSSSVGFEALARPFALLAGSSILHNYPRSNRV